MLYPGRYRPSSRTITFTPLSFGPSDSVNPNFTDHTPRFSCRHSFVRSASGLGRMARFGIYDLHSSEWNCDMRDEEDAGEPQGTQEEDCRERRNERREFLCTSTN